MTTRSTASTQEQSKDETYFIRFGRDLGGQIEEFLIVSEKNGKKVCWFEHS